MYMNTKAVKLAIHLLEGFPRSKADQQMVDEAILRLRKYESGEYLINILPDSRPEWYAARKILEELFKKSS